MEILAVLFGFTLAIWQGVAIIMALKESRSKTFWKSTEDLARSFYAHLIAVSDYHNPFAYLEPLADCLASEFSRNSKNGISESARDYGRIMAYTLIDEAVKSAREQGQPLRYTEVVSRAIIVCIRQRHPTYFSRYDRDVHFMVSRFSPSDDE